MSLVLINQLIRVKISIFFFFLALFDLFHQGFSDVFRAYRKRSVTLNGLIS